MPHVAISRRRVILRLGIAIEFTDVEDISVVDSGLVFTLLTAHDMTKSRRRVLKLLRGSRHHFLTKSCFELLILSTRTKVPCK